MDENTTSVTDTRTINSFVIGTVVGIDEREVTIRETGELKDVKMFGLLVGRTCIPFDIFQGHKMYKKAAALEDGMTVLAVIGTSVGQRGLLRTYLNGICECPAELRGQLRDMMNGEGK